MRSNRYDRKSTGSRDRSDRFDRPDRSDRHDRSDRSDRFGNSKRHNSNRFDNQKSDRSHKPKTSLQHSTKKYSAARNNTSYKTTFDLLISVICTDFQYTKDIIAQIRSITNDSLKISDAPRFCLLADPDNIRLVNQIITEFGSDDKVTVIKTKTNNVAYHDRSFYAQFGSKYFLILSDFIELRPFSFEKTLNFLRLRSDASAAIPQFYNTNGKLLPTCRRFPNLLNILSRPFLSKKSPLLARDTMQEKGNRSYYTIHRVDCLVPYFCIFNSSEFFKFGGFSDKESNTELKNPCKFSSSSLNILDLSHRIIKGGKKVMFFPFSRVILKSHGETFSNRSGLIQKIKYLFSNGLELIG